MGVELAEVEIGARGLAGDRQWAVYTDDGGIKARKTTWRFRRVDGLLEWRARFEGEVPVVESPTGERYGADDAGARLRAAMDRPLEIRAAEIPHHDESPVPHLLTTASLASLGALLGGPVDVAQSFRPNVVLDPGGGLSRTRGSAGSFGSVTTWCSGSVPGCRAASWSASRRARSGRTRTSCGRSPGSESCRSASRPRSRGAAVSASAIRPSLLN